jgi:hypothetical protein
MTREHSLSLFKLHIPLTMFFLMVFYSSCTPAMGLPSTTTVWSGDDVLERDDYSHVSHVIIYLHGRIVEEQGTDAVHPIHGRYEYAETLDYLATSGGQIISEVRPTGTDAMDYARSVVRWITHLIGAGVPEQDIFVVGFSKGAAIAIFVSDMLHDPNVNFVLIGVCGDWINDDPAITLSGRILSLYETSDDSGGPCQSLAARSPGVSDFEEVSFSTGEGHGAFYQADEFWLDIIMEWMDTGM